MIGSSERHNVLTVGRAIGFVSSAIMSKDLHIKYSEDFKALRAAVKTIDGKDLSEQADRKFFDFTEANSFWIGVYGQDGTCISVQAARMDMLGKTNLATHWENQQSRIYSGGKLGSEHADISYKIAGRVVYHGDMFLRKEYRGGDLSVLIPQLGYLVALQKFNPDWLYVFISPKGIETGYQTRLLFSHQKKRGTHWLNAPDGVNGDDYICWFDRGEIFEMAETIVRDALE